MTSFSPACTVILCDLPYHDTLFCFLCFYEMKYMLLLFRKSKQLMTRIFFTFDAQVHVILLKRYIGFAYIELKDRANVLQFSSLTGD